MQIVNLERGRLAAYVKAQLSKFFPNEEDVECNLIDTHLNESLKRLSICINQVRMWKQGEFDIFHSSQYCIFLYYLANTIWQREHATRVCTKLFLLNKALNGIDCFYEIKLPEVFFIGHSVGIVLSKATYGNFLVIYQNSTVGKNRGDAPKIDDGVILYPNTAIIGKCHIGSRSVIAQSVSVVNRNTEINKIVFQGINGELIFKEQSHDFLNDFFREV